MTNRIYKDAFSPLAKRSNSRGINVGHAIECAKIEADKYIKRTNRSNAVIRENKVRAKRNLLQERHVNEAKHLLKFVTTDGKGVQTVKEVKIARMNPTREQIAQRKQDGIKAFCMA